jgi:hypothetical protein
MFESRSCGMLIDILGSSSCGIGGCECETIVLSLLSDLVPRSFVSPSEQQSTKHQTSSDATRKRPSHIDFLAINVSICVINQISVNSLSTHNHLSMNIAIPSSKKLYKIAPKSCIQHHPGPSPIAHLHLIMHINNDPPKIPIISLIKTDSSTNVYSRRRLVVVHLNIHMLISLAMNSVARFWPSSTGAAEFRAILTGEMRVCCCCFWEPCFIM